LTVSPVPLTATNSGNHVLIATMESKSILRAVAGQMKRRFGFVDYFPSYEIINSPPFRGTFFESNQRTVNHVGVNHVMDSFFKCLHSKFPMSDMPKIQTKDNEKPATSSTRPELDKKAVKRDEDVICEEELLNAFAK
jgi:hypothetical protein